MDDRKRRPPTSNQERLIISPLGDQVTKTDDIQRAVSSELERRRASIDLDCNLRSMQIVVEMNERTGDPRRVLIRTESSGGIIDRQNT
jgi:hypothetical protein